MTVRRSLARRLGLVMLSGLLLCVAVTTVESLSQPLHDLPVEVVRPVVVAVAWTWTLSGPWWAVAAWRFADLPPRRLIALVVPLALAISLLHLVTWKVGLTLSLDAGSPELLGRARQPEGTFFHVLWANLFFGGLYLLSFAGTRRALRSRRLLAELASRRAQADADVQQARLRALRGQLQPGILIEALETLQTVYVAAPDRAEALFDELVGFLRAAMPAIREKGATLRSELVLVERYAELRRRLGVGRGAAVSSMPGAASDVAFPALCLLPLVEALGYDIPPDAAMRIRSTGGNGWTGAQLDIPCGARALTSEVGADAERRLRVALAAHHGTGADVTLHRLAGKTSVILRLSSPVGRPSPAEVPIAV